MRKGGREREGGRWGREGTSVSVRVGTWVAVLARYRCEQRGSCRMQVEEIVTRILKTDMLEMRKKNIMWQEYLKTGQSILLKF